MNFSKLNTGWVLFAAAIAGVVLSDNEEIAPVLGMLFLIADVMQLRRSPTVPNTSTQSTQSTQPSAPFALPGFGEQGALYPPSGAGSQLPALDALGNLGISAGTAVVLA